MTNDDHDPPAPSISCGGVRVWRNVEEEEEEEEEDDEDDERIRKELQQVYVMSHIFGSA